MTQATLASNHQTQHHHYTENGEHIVSKDAQFSDIGQWLKKGWQDLLQAPGASAFYGLMMAAAVMLVYGAYQAQPVMIFKTATFFIMLSPFLATGLYALSQQMHTGQTPHLMQSMLAWRHNTTNFALFALSLGVIIAIWGRIVPMIAAIAQSDQLLIVNPEAGVMGFLSSQAGMDFLGYFIVMGALVGAFVFAISVVTIPLMLKDAKVGVISAMVLSFKVTMENKAVMAAWALTIGALITLGLLSVGILMVVVMPLLAYASWHAFNDLVSIENPTQ